MDAMPTTPTTAAPLVREGRLAFRPGYIVALEFSAVGGVKYQRTAGEERVEGERLEADFSTRKTVDNVHLVGLSRALVNRGYHVMDRFAVPTPIGYFADDDALAKIRAALEPLQHAAREFNDMAEAAGSERRVAIEIYPLALDVDNEAAARRIARAVRERLEDLRAALVTGDPGAYDKAREKARNLDRLATGIQADAVRLALDAASEAKKELTSALKREATPEAAGATLDLSALDAAIGLFQEAVEAGA